MKVAYELGGRYDAVARELTIRNPFGFGEESQEVGREAHVAAEGSERDLKLAEYAKTDMESTKKQIQLVDKELARLNDEMKMYSPQIEAIEKSMQTRESSR
ncbi:hypothetical protein NQ317_006371 [Molorchus minor]|uniref:Uncharacterized protein n=1 Tax=Molorchus minor TaxID=1323400 RepID=A0ABQ9JN43_9CUCU|nr:hypothetical protein NQ317_006371 [Molorchus minor]